MKRFDLAITDELFRAINHATEGGSRNAHLEDWLWRVKEIQAAAKSNGIKRKPRLPRGRPKGKASKK